MSLLIDMPSDVVAELFSLFLECSDFGLLDSAFCNHKYRWFYHDLLRKTRFCVEKERFNSWLSLRKVKPATLFLSDRLITNRSSSPKFDESVNLDVKVLRYCHINKKYYDLVVAQDWSSVTSLQFGLAYQSLFQRFSNSFFQRLTSLVLYDADIDSLTRIRDNCRRLSSFKVSLSGDNDKLLEESILCSNQI